MTKKNFELDDENLDQVSGGTDDDGWYWGFGFPPDYLNACPNCGGGVYRLGSDDYRCGPCGWTCHSDKEFAPGHINKLGYY